MKTQDASPRKTGVWEIDQANATLQTTQITGKVNISQPESGIQVEYIFGKPVSQCSMLAFTHVPAVERVSVDQYVRGDDLVCRYRSKESNVSVEDARRLTDQVYWRHIDSNNLTDLCSVELDVSLQTDRLDLQPRVSLNSQIAAEEVSLVRFLNQPLDVNNAAKARTEIEPIGDSLDCDPSGSIALLVQNKTEDWSYIQALHFTDETSCDRIRVQRADGQIAISVLLFVEHLEKGVIRRARLRSSFLNTANVDETALNDWFDSFATSELPLTV